MVLFGKHVGSCLKGLMILTNDPVIPLLSIYSREMETYNDTKTYTWIFLEVLFIIIAKT